MKTAIIADIHGNFHALEAVLKAIKLENPDEIICAGDMVNPLWDSKQVLELLQSEKIICLRGNHEDYLINYLKLLANDNFWKNRINGACRKFRIYASGVR